MGVLLLCSKVGDIVFKKVSLDKIEQQQTEILNRLKIVQSQQQDILAGLYVIGKDLDNAKSLANKKTEYFGK